MKFNAENNKERSLSCRSAVSVVAQRSQPCLYQLHVLSAMLSWWSLALFSLWIVPFCPSPSLPFPPLQRGEVVTSRCHGSKIFGWSKRKRHLKSDFGQLQTSSILFNFISFGKCLRNSLGLNPKVPYLSLEEEKDNFCVVFTYSIKQACEIGNFPVAWAHRRQKNVQNSLMHV